jgi:hypothetical protein
MKLIDLTGQRFGRLVALSAMALVESEDWTGPAATNMHTCGNSMSRI